MIRALLCIALPLLLVGCAGMSAEQADAVRAVLEEMLSKGQLTQSQFDSLSLLLQPTPDWLGVLSSVGETLISVVLALLGVKVWRGGITARKGAPPAS